MKFTDTDYVELENRLAELEGRPAITRATQDGDETIRLCCAYDVRFYGGKMYAEASYEHRETSYHHVNEMVENHDGSQVLAVRVAVVRAAIKALELKLGLPGKHVVMVP
jgi:hypothetical protein